MTTMTMTLIFHVRYKNKVLLRFTLKAPMVLVVLKKHAKVQVIICWSSKSVIKVHDGDGFRNEARYTWTTKIISPGKGFRKGEVYREILSAADAGGDADLTFTFKIDDVNTVRGTKNVDILPTDVNSLTDLDAQEILRGLADNFKTQLIAEGATNPKAIVVGNGIYLESDVPFSVSTTEIAVADVMNSQKTDDDVVPIVRVNTVAELPVECCC